MSGMINVLVNPVLIGLSAYGGASGGAYGGQVLELRPFASSIAAVRFFTNRIIHQRWKNCGASSRFGTMRHPDSNAF